MKPEDGAAKTESELAVKPEIKIKTEPGLEAGTGTMETGIGTGTDSESLNITGTRTGTKNRIFLGTGIKFLN